MMACVLQSRANFYSILYCKLIQNSLSLAMELEANYQVYFPSPLSRDQIKITKKSNFNRRRASVDLETRAGAIWEKRLKENPHLFNGTKFRFAGLSVKSGKTVTKQDNKITLVLADPVSPCKVELRTGFSNYKDYTTTNMSSLAEEFQKHGMEKYGDPQACMADIIGHSALLITADNFVVIQLRSQTVGEAAGMWHFAGGHPEPEELGISCSEDLDETEPGKIVDEIYDSLLREMKEELNLSEEELSDPVLVAIGKDKDSFYKPEFNFIIHCRLSAQQVSEKYFAEDFSDIESDDIAFLDVRQLHLSGRQSVDLFKFKTYEPEIVTVNVEQIASSSLQLMENLQTAIGYNPKLLCA